MNAPVKLSAVSAAHPFPGLRPFAYQDREFFFGRQDQIYALYRRIDRFRFIAVVGSSGSGKSSPFGPGYYHFSMSRRVRLAAAIGCGVKCARATHRCCA